MRGDSYVREVLAKCDALKKARLWPAEPRMRPSAWLRNFDEDDKPVAALLLDNFTFYKDDLTNQLLVSSYNSITDGLSKGPSAPDRSGLIRALQAAVFTRVVGEEPSPTDSGNLFCRKARQSLRIPDSRFCEPRVALEHAKQGTTVVFLDDFVGSGDQFLFTWMHDQPVAGYKSFAKTRSHIPFAAIYVTLVATDFGLERIRQYAPEVAITTAHELDASATVQGLQAHPSLAITDVRASLDSFLDKYAARLTPPPVFLKDPSWMRFGYKNRGLLFAFEHSVPDATLPIFWAEGGRNWSQLVERS